VVTKAAMIRVVIMMDFIEIVVPNINMHPRHHPSMRRVRAYFCRRQFFYFYSPAFLMTFRSHTDNLTTPYISLIDRRMYKKQEASLNVNLLICQHDASAPSIRNDSLGKQSELHFQMIRPQQ
jgi:hypothetical protein